MVKLLIWAPALETKERANAFELKTGQANLHELRRCVDHNHKGDILGYPSLDRHLLLSKEDMETNVSPWRLLPSGWSIAHNQNVLEFV